MQAFFWMMGTLASFALMAVGARELSGDIATQQTLFIRSVIGLFCVLLISFLSQKRIKFQTKRLKLHTMRNIFHFLGQYGWFIGLGLLPLAEVFALEFTVPIWTLIIASLFLGEKITQSKLVSIALGFLGVFVILKPGIAMVNSASLFVLASAVCYAISHTATKSLSATESPLSILFYMCLVQMPIGLCLSVSSWVWPEGMQWSWLVIIGLTALSAHFCIAKAMQYAEATTVVTLDFLRLPLIALVGVVLYSESIEIGLIFGGLLMLAANIVSMRGRRVVNANNKEL
ncbi:DMT family transporter [Thalassotalea marina]|uniref:Membrane protein n=1 Tax=Thalassotalea marina TaxID=1673741 RepID=A0A919BRJ2_9GAMM|nr:DMT family transporter [Thalassotalea marina]GHG08117.1 membrane protein [Thalassotalea marina]